MTCYRVELPCTNAMRNSASIPGDSFGYITVEDGAIFVVAENASEVGAHFPSATAITRVGIGMVLVSS